MKPPADTAGRGRRLRDAALALPLIGGFLLTPPAILVFAGDRHILGVPLIVIYLFAVWAALILGAGLLAGRLRRSAGGE